MDDSHSSSMEKPPPPPHIAILPTPGMGHLIPIVQFATNLHRRHRVSSTLIIPTDGPLSAAQTNLLSSAAASAVDHVLLPPYDFSDLPLDVKIETRISLSVARSLAALRDAVRDLHRRKKIAAFVVDLFGTDGFDVAFELKIPTYIFFPSTAMTLSLFLHLPELDRKVPSEYREVPEKLQIPGCIPIHGGDLLDPLQDKKNEAYKWVLHHTKRYRLAEGIIVNSFKELEPGPVQFLQKKETGRPVVYPIGPLIQTGSSGVVDNESSACLKWLDDQPSGSVLFVSFGSGGTLSHDQIIELALGLEMSEQRFLWVIRNPSSTISNVNYFKIQNSDDPLAHLPQGFLERTRARGLVIPLWGPQAAILAHPSTGAFLTHCGWNSVLESVVNGVPMIAWPLYAEQRMNAVILNEDVRVAMRPRAGENGMVGRDEVANVVKGLIEGEEGKGIRSRMRDLKDAAANSLSENGASTKFMDELVKKWSNSASI